MEILVTLLLILFLSALIMIKNQVTHRQRTKVIDAIFEYDVEMIRIFRNSEQISYDSMESYLSTLLRLWDWGYKNIVSAEHFERIRAYIET